MEDNIENSKQSSKENSKAMIPGAIVIAGLLVAGAVFYSGGGGSGNGGQPEVLSVSELLDQTAKKVGVNVDDFNECLESQRHRSIVQQSYIDAGAAGGRGTPYNVIVTQDGQRIAVSGAQPYEAIAAQLDAVLAGGSLPQATDITIPEVTEDDHIRGNTDAKVFFVEYSDIDCPFCSQLHETMIDVVDNYDPGDVAWVYRHFPLTNIHPTAAVKAEASECIAELGDNDAFWEFLDILFA